MYGVFVLCNLHADGIRFKRIFRGHESVAMG